MGSAHVNAAFERRPKTKGSQTSPRRATTTKQGRSVSPDMADRGNRNNEGPQSTNLATRRRQPRVGLFFSTRNGTWPPRGSQLINRVYQDFGLHIHSSIPAQVPRFWYRFADSDSRILAQIHGFVNQNTVECTKMAISRIIHGLLHRFTDYGIDSRILIRGVWL